MKKLFTMLRACLFAAGAVGAMLAPVAAMAQQKFKTPGPDPGVVTKYTQQHTIDVGDVPGHQIRVAIVHSKYSDQAGQWDGVKTVESTGWLSSDYINGSGRFTAYAVTSMANGDKIYSRAEGLSQTSVAADGARKTTYSTVTTYTGGTGRFAALRGSARAAGSTDFKTGTTTSSSDGEYWFEK